MLYFGVHIFGVMYTLKYSTRCSSACLGRDSCRKEPVMQKTFPFHGVIMYKFSTIQRYITTWYLVLMSPPTLAKGCHSAEYIFKPNLLNSNACILLHNCTTFVLGDSIVSKSSLNQVMDCRLTYNLPLPEALFIKISYAVPRSRWFDSKPLLTQ